IQEALHYKEAIEAVDGVSDVMWLDDVIDIQTPIEMADADTVETYYKDNHALFTFYVEEGKEVEATGAGCDIIGEANGMAGEALHTAISQQTSGQDTSHAALLLVRIIIIILPLSTRSWIGPVFFMTAIQISVLINLGTNTFMGEIADIS